MTYHDWVSTCTFRFHLGDFSPTCDNCILIDNFCMLSTLVDINLPNWSPNYMLRPGFNMSIFVQIRVLSIQEKRISYIIHNVRFQNDVSKRSVRFCECKTTLLDIQQNHPKRTIKLYVETQSWQSNYLLIMGTSDIDLSMIGSLRMSNRNWHQRIESEPELGINT
jgi:hypothetical protein